MLYSHGRRNCDGSRSHSEAGALTLHPMHLRATPTRWSYCCQSLRSGSSPSAVVSMVGQQGGNAAVSLGGTKWVATVAAPATLGDPKAVACWLAKPCSL